MATPVEFAKLWNPGLSGIELFSAQLIRHHFGKHFHEEYTIGMNDAGLGCFLHGGETHCAYPGRFNLINPGAVHTGQAKSVEGWTFRNLYVSASRVECILAQLEWSSNSLPYFHQPVVSDQVLQSAFHRLFRGLSEPTSLLEQQSYLLQFFAHLFLNYTEPSQGLRSRLPLSHTSWRSETKAVAMIRDYLEAHYTETISINVLAQVAGLSPYYLIRTFHQQVGLPPHSYQRHWQLLQAKRSLHTAKPLADLAVEHGFYDQSHLNRRFKRAFGITPGQYRQGNFVQYG